MIADSSNLREYPDNYFDTVVDTFCLCSYDDPLDVVVVGAGWSGLAATH